MKLYSRNYGLHRNRSLTKHKLTKVIIIRSKAAIEPTHVVKVSGEVGKDKKNKGYNNRIKKQNRN